MSATNSHTVQPGYIRRPKQDGAAAVEFSLVAILFFLIVLGIIEIARAMYLYNTLAEVTRRAAHAAANISFTNGPALDLARKRAVFDEVKGALPFGSPITYRNIRIGYLYLPKGVSELRAIPQGSMPTCPAANRFNCMDNPNGANCIRAVQASVCTEETATDTCTPVDYKSLFPLINLPMTLPTSLTIVSAETLGYKKGDVPCN